MWRLCRQARQAIAVEAALPEVIFSIPRGALVTTPTIEERNREFLAHYGVLGMKWGVRRRHPNSSPGSTRPPSSVAGPHNHPSLTAPRPHVSPEAGRAAELHSLARRHGSHNLSNEELKALVARMNLEDQYGRLDQKKVSTGKKIALGVLIATGAVAGGIAKQTATSFGSKYAAKGLEELIKKAAVKK
jgi:hypothetical protein